MYLSAMETTTMRRSTESLNCFFTVVRADVRGQFLQAFPLGPQLVSLDSRATPEGRAKHDILGPYIVMCAGRY